MANQSVQLAHRRNGNLLGPLGLGRLLFAFVGCTDSSWCVFGGTDNVDDGSAHNLSGVRVPTLANVLLSGVVPGLVLNQINPNVGVNRIGTVEPADITQLGK